MTYHKIPTVFERNPITNHKTLLYGKYSTRTLGLLSGLAWDWTEKVDGRNTRVIIADGTVRYGGRTDKAQMPADLVNKLRELFPPDKLLDMFPAGAVLYGEGYGAGIQKGGGNYIPDDVSFILFDVLCGGFWLERPNVLDVARNLSIEAVPFRGCGTLMEAVEYVCSETRTSFISEKAVMEGLVMRPPLTLYDRRGDRIITKVKTKDFQ